MRKRARPLLATMVGLLFLWMMMRTIVIAGRDVCADVAQQVAVARDGVFCWRWR